LDERRLAGLRRAVESTDHRRAHEVDAFGELPLVSPARYRNRRMGGVIALRRLGGRRDRAEAAQADLDVPDLEPELREMRGRLDELDDLQEILIGQFAVRHPDMIARGGKRL